MDLSKSNAEKLTEVVGCSVRKTKINFNFANPNLNIIHTNCSDNDFSRSVIDIDWFYGGTDIENRLYDSNFSNTGLRIKYSSHLEEKNKILDKILGSMIASITTQQAEAAKFFSGLNSKFRQNDEHKETIEKLEKIRLRLKGGYIFSRKDPKIEEAEFLLWQPDRLGIEIKKGHYVGCYINGRLQKTKEQKDAERQEQLRKYNDFEQAEYGDIVKTLQLQISNMQN